MAESIHGKLNRVRKPRVHITYDVETEGATVVKDLPFVVGVLGDFTGNPSESLKPLKDRKFVNIDRDNFNDVMARMAPGLEFRVANTLAEDGSEMAVRLKFNSMQDFEPARIVEQVEPLKKLSDFAMPSDPAEAQIVPVPARPFPAALRDPDLLPVPRRASDIAAVAWCLVAFGGLPWLAWRLWRRFTGR